MKHAIVPAALTLALAAALSACGGSSPAAQSPQGAASPSAQASSSAPLPTVQPCDALDPAAISATLGQKVRVDTGTAASPVCFLRPDDPAGAAFDMNYQWFYVHGLDAYFRKAKLPAGTLTTISVPGADAAKLIVNSDKKAYHVTGYVQNGALVQSVNGVGARKDAAHILAATKLILAQLSAGAPGPSAASSGAASGTPGSSPSAG